MKGPSKAKNDRKGAYKKGLTNVKMKEIDPKKMQISKKYL
jgi:hypothetical protein